jgi:hypothetical protein
VFSETLGASEKFQQWFHDEILQHGKPMNENHWDLLLKRYYKFNVADLYFAPTHSMHQVGTSFHIWDFSWLSSVLLGE